MNKGNELLARLDRIPIWPYPRRLLWVIGVGFFFSFFDIVSIGLALPRIQSEFNISLSVAAWSITSSLLGYIIGSFVIARISDLYGRRLALYLSIIFFSLGSLCTAFSMSFVAIVIWRFITGIGIGAEISEVSTYLGEMSPAKCRGRYTSLGVAWGFLGFALVPFVALALVPHFSWGWRAMFLIGGLGGLIILYMRRHLPDSPRWLIAHDKISEAELMISAAEKRASLQVTLPEVGEISSADILVKKGFFQLFKPPFGYRIILFSAIWFAYYVGNYAWLTLGASLLDKHGFSLSKSLSFVAIASMGFVVGPLLAAWMGDRVERKWSISLACIIWIASLFSIACFQNEIIVLGCGFLASGTIGFMVPLMYTYTAEHFPTESRATSVALTDGLGHLGGAFCSQIVLGISAYFLNQFAAAFIVMALTGVISLLLILFARSMTQKSLSDI